EVDRYEGLMRDVVKLVVDEYDGSLKAEHGTGRNMAPFVEHEWGTAAYEAMKEIKTIFDPLGIINPGVIFNDDPKCFIKNFKPLPLCEASVDKCIECGFCEVNCLTCGLTLSSRQRIVIRREIARLEADGSNPKLLRELKRGYYYLGNMTCAGDGLCSTSCPMGINTGHLTHLVREKDAPHGGLVWTLGNLAANHLHGIKVGLRPVLTIADTAHTVLGTGMMTGITQMLHSVGVPLWVPAMPKSHSVRPKRLQQKSFPDKVVYFPSCINQAFGVAKGSPDNTPLTDKMIALLQKAKYEVIFPENMDNLCCGTIWESKGMPDIADRKTKELEGALWKASGEGKYPVLCDQSPCLYRMRSQIKSMKLYEPVEFIETFLVDRLDFHPTDEPIAIHTTCSMTKMKLQPCLIRLARRCSNSVLVPAEVGCCGFAGDKGFTYPEVNKYALRKLAPQLEAAHVKTGYSNSRTCEIGLTTNGGVPYLSIVYLVDQCTTAKE
ncbi:MAG: FAD-linked oxidase C-terminal domain-containing protein, partial [Planctomycetia bacterium]|nr:FAD-linked oxidase C-terminal domain-containing protein [Planctomycetia bacterium]